MNCPMCGSCRIKKKRDDNYACRICGLQFVESDLKKDVILHIE